MLITVKNIGKSYRREPVLRDVSFSADTGETLCILGKNGSGKSTLFAILAGMLRPDSGEVYFDGESPFQNKNILRRVGFVPQGDTLFEDLTVEDNIRFWASAFGGYKKASPFPELLGISEFRRKKVRELSGGMRRRTAICTALLHDPDYLILDEPFTGLDLVNRRELAERLKELSGTGKTLLYTAHSGGELLGPALGRVLIIQDGGSLVELPQSYLTQSGNIDDNLYQIIKGAKL